MNQTGRSAVQSVARAFAILAAVPAMCRFRLTLKCLGRGYTALSAGGLRGMAILLLRDLVPAIAPAASLGLVDGRMWCLPNGCRPTWAGTT